MRKLHLPVLFAVLLLTASCGGSTVETVFTSVGQLQTRVTKPPAPPPEWEQLCPGSKRLVTYFVEGTASSVDITLETSQGNTEQATNKAVPLNIKGRPGLRAGCFDSGQFYYIAAQNNGESGSVSCRVQVDSRTESSANSSGAYVIATCSGSVP